MKQKLSLAKYKTKISLWVFYFILFFRISPANLIKTHRNFNKNLSLKLIKSSTNLLHSLNLIYKRSSKEPNKDLKVEAV